MAIVVNQLDMTAHQPRICVFTSRTKLVFAIPLNYGSHREKDLADSKDGETGEAATDIPPDAEPSAANGPTKFTLTADECLLVRELFAWLVEPCLAFLRREVSEMVRHYRSCC